MKPYLRYIKNVRKIPIPQVKFVAELMGNIELRIERHVALENEFKGVDKSEYAEYHSALYAIVRVTKPNIVVETGVFEGAGSCAILLALERNDKGHLYSIDLPSPRIPPDKKAGWRIQHHLRKRWLLVEGKSSEKLPQLLDTFRHIGIFLHDSEHSYENMLFEYKTAWEHIRDGGLLLSHDITRNKAFRNFAIEHNKRYLYMMHNLAGLRK